MKYKPSSTQPSPGSIHLFRIDFVKVKLGPFKSLGGNALSFTLLLDINEKYTTPVTSSSQIVTIRETRAQTQKLRGSKNTGGKNRVKIPQWTLSNASHFWTFLLKWANAFPLLFKLWVEFLSLEAESIITESDLLLLLFHRRRNLLRLYCTVQFIRH